MNYRPTPGLVSDSHARSVTSRMFVPGTVAALEAGAQEGKRYHRRATLCCGEKNCGCGVPEILRNGTMAGFLGNLGDEPTMFDAGDLIEPDFSFPTDNYLIPINLTAQPTFETTMYDPASILASPNFIAPARPLQLQTSIPGTSAASLVASGINAASQLVRSANSVPTTRALVPATALTPSGVGAQLSNLFSAQSIMPGISNGTLLLLAAAAAFALNATSGKRR